MQAHRILIQILALLALFSATLAIPSLQFNTTLLCTEKYWLSINYFETLAGDEITFSGGVTSSSTRIVTFNVDASTAGSGSIGTYIVYPGPTYTYFAQLKRNDTAIYQIELKDTATQACTGLLGLTTTGLVPAKQAVWVADVFRKDTNPDARGFFWNSALQTAATAILTNPSACTPWQTNNSPFLSSRGYDTTSTSSCLLVQPTSADAGSFIQYLSTIPSQLENKWDIMDEVAFAQDTTNRYWVMILATRPRLRCSNKYRSYAEGCDDGNNADNDGCDSECNVEAGWTCTESVLVEGSTCVQSPAAPTTPVAVPVSSPTTTPQGQTPTAGTPTATPTSTPTAVPSATPTGATPTGSTPTGSTPTATPTATPIATPTAAPKSSTPTGSTPAGQTPTGSTPTGQTPTSQTPSGQTPTGQTPSSQTPSTQTPSSSPSSPASPQGSTPSSSSPSAAGPSGSESPSALSPDSPLASQSPDGSVSPSDSTPSSSGPFSPRPSRTPSSSGIVSGSEQITASVMMVIVTMLSVVIAAF